jgi:hypothetical protein
VSPSANPRAPRHLRNVALDDAVDLGYLQDRYGSGRSKAPVIIAAVIVGAPFLAWVLWAGYVQGHPDVSWTTTAFSDISSTSVTVSFDVSKPASRTAECLVRALDDKGIEVGRADVPVQDQSETVHVDYALAVTARPSSAFVASCQLTN